MENNEIAANGMISENTENTENTENKCAEKTNGVAGPGRNAYDVLNERGFLKQCSHPEELRELLGKEKLTFYIGFDPTAESLTVGHYVAMCVMAHMQKCGHHPIVLLGGGTAMIADPSGKTELRKLLSVEELDNNVAGIKKQMERLVRFDGENGAVIVNNADWLRNLNFMDFMRDIAVHFSVNEMLRAECYKQRFERGLTFFEFSYMLMQSYDFLCLNRKYGCELEMGGDDQWSNILGGADLIRRKERKRAYALTTCLLTTADGKKMGKTEKGAVWLSKERTSVYDFYQYFRNVNDADVKTCLSLLTFLPMDEIEALCAEGANINEAKRVLAYTVTSQVHGEDEAKRAEEAALALFGGKGDLTHMPTVALSDADIEESGMSITRLLVLAGIEKSNSAAIRSVREGGISVNDRKVTDTKAVLDSAELADGIILKKGKKTFVRLIHKD